MATGLPECGPGEMLLPDTAHIIPSQPNAWRAARAPDQRYTGMQRRQLEYLGLSLDDIGDVIVRQAATRSEWWWGEGQKPPVYVMPCPVIGERTKGVRRQLLVISPDGQRKYVREDGTILGGRKW